MSLRILPVNHFDAATLTGPAIATLPLTNMQLYGRDAVWRSPNIDRTTVSGHWNGEVRTVSSLLAAPGNLIGSHITLTLYSNADWTGTSVSYNWDFFTPTGLGWSLFGWGSQPWVIASTDRTALRASMLQFFTAFAASSFTIAFDNLYVDQPGFEASRIWLAEFVDAPFNANYGAAPAWKSNSELQRMVGGKLSRLKRALFRELRFDVNLNSEADRALWSDLMFQCDPGNEIVISLFPTDSNEKRRRDFTVIGSLEAINPMVFENFEYHKLQMAVLES